MTLHAPLEFVPELKFSSVILRVFYSFSLFGDRRALLLSFFFFFFLTTGGVGDAWKKDKIVDHSAFFLSIIY